MCAQNLPDYRLQTCTFTRVTGRWSFADRIDNPVNIEELVGWSKENWTRETAAGPKGSSFFTADFFNAIFTLAVARASRYPSLSSTGVTLIAHFTPK
jgi:hypothetical protein